MTKNRNDLRKRHTLIHLSIVIFLFLLTLKPLYASVDCTNPPDCYVSGTVGSAGAGSSPVDIGTVQSGYDTNRFTSTTGYDLWVVGRIRINSTPYKTFENLYFGDAGLTQNMDVTFHSTIIDGSDFKIDASVSRRVETSQLNLNHVNFETTPALQFVGSDNQINLSDSSVKFLGQQPEFVSSAPLTINALSGESSFYNFFGEHRPSLTTINLAPNTTLLFEDSGSVLLSAGKADKLYFSAPVIGNVDNNATLKFRYSNVYFNSTDFNFTNSSTLELFGSQTEVEFEKLSLATNSQMVLSNNTTLTAHDLYLDNATIDLESGARVNAENLWVNGPATLEGPGGNGAGIHALNFVIQDNTAFNQNSSKVTVSQDFLLSSGSQLNIDDAWFSAKTIVAYGGSVNVTNGGDFVVAGGFLQSDRDATFNIDSTSYLLVNSNAEIPLVPSLVINNDGLMTLNGYLSGNGTIFGNGVFNITDTGQITPGWDGGNESQKMNTITFENAVVFDNFGTFGNQSNQSQYYAHIDVVGSTETSDLLQYDDNDFNITNLTSIKVNTASAKTADELDGKSFTIIASYDSNSSGSSTGTLATGGTYPAIVEGGDIPALIDFTIFNNITNGNDDVTLLAEKDFNQLLKHPSIKPHHTLSTIATTAVDQGTGQATTTIVTLVPAQTAPTGTTSTSTTTVAPSTGNTILTTVTVAPNLTGDGNHQQTVSTTVTTPTGTIVGQSTQTTQLTSTQPPAGSAHEVVTVTTTDSSGSILSSATSTTQTAPAQGSTNNTGMATLLVNAVNDGNTSIQSALNTLTNGQTGSHIESLHAEPFSSNLTISLEQNDLFLSMLLGHNRFSKTPVFSDELVTPYSYIDKQIWMETAYSKGKVNGKNNLGNFDYSITNVLFGKDFTDNTDSNVGIFFGIGHQKMDEHDTANQDLKAINYNIGGYGAFQYTNWQLHLAAGYGYGRHDSKRRVMLGSTLNGVNEDEFSSHGVYMGLKGLYKPIYENTFLSLSPDLSLLYNFYQQGEIDEKGVGALALKIDSVIAQNLMPGIGLNASLKHPGRWQNIHPIVFIRYERDLLADRDDYHKVKAALASHPSQKGSFTGQNRGADILTTGLGLSGDIGDKWQLNGGVVQGWASHGSEFGFGLNAVYKF